jgi:hypothetical protein
MYLDRITDAIAHFIGLFEMTAEQARLRDAYNKFVPPPERPVDEPAIPSVTVGFHSPYTLADYTPDVAYTPVPPTIETIVPHAGGKVDALPMPDMAQRAVDHAAQPLVLNISAGSALLAVTAAPEPDLPGSIILSTHQQTQLLDDDYVNIGNSGLVFQPLRDYGDALDSLVHDARLDTPFGHGDPPDSVAAIKSAILSTAEIPDSLHTQFEDSGTPYYLTDAPILNGTTVDGESWSGLPQLKDYLPPAGDPEAAPSSTDLTTTIRHGANEAGSLTLDAGGNTLVNTAALANGGLTAPTFAILGDHFETNAIVQINAWSDHDLIGSSLCGVSRPDSQTQGWNAAAFTRIDPAAGQVAAAAGPGQPVAFPTHWQVDTIDGDMVFMSWISQFNFVSDNDIAVYSSTGASTFVTAGGNTALNQLSFADLGHAYDLIIIGGSYFEANFIQQSNVLLDDDLVAGVGGFQTSGAAGASTGGNILWNAASITNIGAGDRFDALPDYLREACSNLAAGNTDMPSFGGDAAFAGYPGLHVLYISGDVLELQMVNQTNVLGDADQVALVRNDFAEGWHGPSASVSTGSNVLVNQASITDLDTTGKVTYVGGDHYSDEILFQAELVKPASETLGHQDGDSIAYEAIAFMGDHTPDPIQPEIQPAATHHSDDAVSHDVMHTMLA